MNEDDHCCWTAVEEYKAAITEPACVIHTMPSYDFCCNKMSDAFHGEGIFYQSGCLRLECTKSCNEISFCPFCGAKIIIK